MRRALLILAGTACILWAAPSVKRGTLAGLEQNLRRSLEKSEMEILAAPRGVYLQGYGAVFMTDVNLVYTPSINPWRLTIEDAVIAQIHKRKMAQMPVLRENLRQVLLESGSALETVPMNEQIVLVVTFANEQWEVTSGLPSQLTMQARRSNLLDAKLGKVNAENVIRVKEFLISATATHESENSLMASPPRLGEMLIARGLLEQEDLDRALELQRERGDKLGKILVDMGFLAARDVLSALSEQHGIPLAVLDSPPPPVPELDGLSARFMRQSKFFPVAQEGNILTIAMADPMDFETIAAVRGFSGFRIAVQLAGESEILDAIERYFGEREKQPGDPDADSAQAGEDLEHLRDMASEAPVIRLVNAMIALAIEKRASDIHIEPFEKEFRVRYRVDGVLFNQEAPPRELKAAIVSRLKLMAKLNIAERRLPQDGRIKIKILGREVDLRVSTLPTLYGESVVMRLLDRSAGDFYDLLKLGFTGYMLDRMKHYTSLPHGIFLVTGPTGSGKSTTLYSALKRINIPDRKIITIEDPVEYQMDGINQIHVNPQIGLTFASGLRHIVRQDPDVIMVGEIRDRETADVAIRAALTGHLVFSTLHTNDAPSAITRLTDMGVENYLINSSLVAVLAQRLVRVICKECIRPDGIETSPFGDRMETFRGGGCDRCSGTGYKSRMGIFELMEMNEEIRALIMLNADASKITEAARRNGMGNLREDGWAKIQAGITTPDEVLRVTQEF